MREIPVAESKTLKLTNVLSRRLQPEEMMNLGLVVTQMTNFIKAAGAMPIGPIIQHMTTGEDGMPQITMLQQANQFISRLEPQYHMDGLMRVKNCLYGHFIGPDDKLGVVYNKLNVYAYEHEIEVSGSIYTIYINNKDGEMVADVFMEKL